MKLSSHCGYVAILGRPNVGKSTLLNKILQKKVSIVSPKPQTTRQQILGIKTVDNAQTIYIDTPGLHKIAKRALNRYMNRAAAAVIHDADLILFMIEALRWKAEDEWILSKLKQATCPVICVVNKVDKIKLKGQLLPFMQKLQEKFAFAEIVPSGFGNNDRALFA
jgi:GTP-binding protein Era